jgi:hypothetical protein
MSKCKSGDEYFPFTRFGMTAEELDEFKKCINMGMAEGEDYPVCYRVMKVLEEIE